MVRLLITYTLLVFLLSATGCGSTEESVPLTFTVTNKQAYLIPADASSCTAIARPTESGGSFVITKDIKESYFTFAGGSLTWASTTSDAYIGVIKVTSSSPNLGGSFTCKIAGDELGFLFSTSTTFATSWDGTIPAGSTVTFNSKCKLICGGITPADVNFSTGIKIEFIGYSQDNTTGDQAPIKYVYDEAVVVNVK